MPEPGEGRERSTGTAERDEEEGGRAKPPRGGESTREREQKPGGRQRGEARTRGSTGGSLACIGNRAHIQGRSALKGDGCEYQVLTDQAQGGKKERKKERKKGERGEARRGHENQRGAAQSGGHQRAHDRRTSRQTDKGEERERGERKAPPPHGREGQEGKGETGRRTTDRQTTGARERRRRTGRNARAVSDQMLTKCPADMLMSSKHTSRCKDEGQRPLHIMIGGKREQHQQ